MAWADGRLWVHDAKGRRLLIYAIEKGRLTRAAVQPMPEPGAPQAEPPAKDEAAMPAAVHSRRILPPISSSLIGTSGSPLASCSLAVCTWPRTRSAARAGPTR